MNMFEKLRKKPEAKPSKILILFFVYTFVAETFPSSHKTLSVKVIGLVLDTVRQL